MSHLSFPRGQTVEEHHIYVLREEDRQFREHALKSSWFSIRGCRTMGKTSLAVRNLEWLKDNGCRVLLVDVGGWGHETVERWIVELAELINLELEEIGAPIVDPALAARDLGTFFVKISKDQQSTLLILDEVDWLRELDFGRKVLARLRSAQTALAQRTDCRLSFCSITLDSLTAIGGAHVAPIVTTLPMRDFPTEGPGAEAVAATLAAGFPLDAPRSLNLARHVLTVAGGQPFQTMILSSELVERSAFSLKAVNEAISAYLEEQRDEPRELLGQIQDMFLQEPLPAHEALNAYEQIRAGHGESAPLATRGTDFLLRSGLVRARQGRAEVKGPVFRQFFDRSWIRRTRDRLFDEQRRRRRSPTRDQSRLCILNTGGTVGMVRRDDKVVEPKDENEFLDNYRELQEIAGIDFEQPFVRDSINVYPEQWTSIAKTIYRKRKDGYTGFVVAHGTDTMAFTASAVAFALGQNLEFPVVFTGAQTTPDIVHGDSHANLVRACAVASKGSNLPEVVISFGSTVLRAVRAQKRDERRFDAFESPAFPALGEITESIALNLKQVRTFRSFRQDLVRPIADGNMDLDLEADFAAGVLMIQLTPGLEPDFYLPALDQGSGDTAGRHCEGVILQTLGAGNVANLQPYSFTDFVRRAVQADIPILITSPYPWSSDLAQGFGPAVEPAQLGAIIGGEMTAAAAASKFRWALAQARLRIQDGTLPAKCRVTYIKQIMDWNYLGEKDGEFCTPEQRSEFLARLRI